MKNVANKLINIIILLIVIDLIKNRYIDTSSYKDELRDKKLYENANSNFVNSDFFQFNQKQSPKLFVSKTKNKYLELHEVKNTSTKYTDIINNSSFYEIPEAIISQYEKIYIREELSRIIRDIEKNRKNLKKSKKNNNNEFFSDEYNFYANKIYLEYEYNYYWLRLISKNSIIYELSTSPIKELINPFPDHIYVEQKICFPTSRLISINNPDSEDNLLIKDIKCDIHQVKILPYLPENNFKLKDGMSSSIHSYLPFSVFPQSKFVFQIMILPDVVERVNGNIYIKFNDKKVLIIPITIIGLENEYKIRPIYYLNWQINKKLFLPFRIANPSNKNELCIPLRD